MCRFAGAHQLDQMRIEETNRQPGTFLSAPKHRATRFVLVEEIEWRGASSRRPGQGADRGMIGKSHRVRLAHQFARGRRSLERLGRSDSGHVQSRIHLQRSQGCTARSVEATSAGQSSPARLTSITVRWRCDVMTSHLRLGERAILWLYWFTSGYGLRALRAVRPLWQYLQSPPL